MRLEFDENGYVCCILYGCYSGSCKEYTGTVPTEPEEYSDIDDWADRAQTRAYYLDDKGNLAYDASRVIEEEPICVDYCEGESRTPRYWIDGKPIYRYVLIANATVKGAQEVVGKIPSSIDTMVYTHGVHYSPTQSNWRPMPCGYFGNNNWDVGYFVLTDGNITFQAGSSIGGSVKLVIVFEYTKK